MGDLVSILGLRRLPGEEDNYPLQYSGLENSMDYIVCGVTKSQTGLSDIHFMRFYLFMFLLEKGMATHCSILAWRIPWTEEPGGLQSMGLQRARHS